MKSSLVRENSVSKGIKAWSVLNCLVGSEVVRNGAKAGGATAVKESSRRDVVMRARSWPGHLNLIQRRISSTQGLSEGKCMID